MRDDALFSRAGLSIDRLRALIAVADAGGMAAAAPRDPVRQSQLSRQLSELAGFVGHPLLRREGREARLTDVALELAAVARGFVDALGDVTRRADGAPSRFSLGAGDSLILWWVLPRLARPLPPQLRLALVTLSQPDIVARVLDGRLDFGLVRGAPTRRELGARALGPLRYAVFVPARLCGGSPGWAALVDAPLALQHSEPGLNAGLEAARVAHGHRGGELSCETFPQVARAIAGGGYAGLLPDIAASELGACARFTPKDALPRPTRVHLVWHPRTLRTRARAAEVLELLAARLARAAAPR